MIDHYSAPHQHSHWICYTKYLIVLELLVFLVVIMQREVETTIFCNLVQMMESEAPFISELEHFSFPPQPIPTVISSQQKA